MAEVRFYHLTSRSLEEVLPIMLERCLARGWRAVVRGAAPERLEALDRLLWTYAEESFLPHGLEGRAPGRPEDHPVWLTAGAGPETPPDALFLIDGAPAEPAELECLETTALIFDGRDEAAVSAARADWKHLTGAGLKAVYWAEGDGGGWERRAESG